MCQGIEYPFYGKLNRARFISQRDFFEASLRLGPEQPAMALEFGRTSYASRHSGFSFL